MVRPVEVRVERVLRASVPLAYSWLTDIQDDDVERAGAVIQKRRVRERTRERIVYEGETEVLGNRSWSVTEVTLRPPSSWEARVTEGPRTGSFTTYALASAPEGARLTVTYRFLLESPAKLFVMRLLKPLVKRDLEKMWDGFQADLEKEASRPKAAT